MGHLMENRSDDKKLDGPLREFVSVTTLHGIRNATSSNSCLLRRLLWFVAFMAACSYLTFLLGTLALDVNSYPFKTVSRIVPKTSNVFPSLTICSLNPFDSKMVNFSKELTAIYRVKDNTFWSEFSNLTLDSLRQTEPYRSILNRKYNELIEMAAPTINKTFIWCIFDNDGRKCTQYIKYINTPSGRCFIFNNDTFNPRISSRPGDKGGFFALMRVDLSEYTFSDLNSVGFKVIIHSRFDSPDVEANGLLISPGFINDIRFSEHQFEFLPEPYNSYGGDTCVPDIQAEGMRPGLYSLGRCVRTKATKAAQDRCGCDWENCTLDLFLNCFHPKFNEFYDHYIKTDRAGCDVPCRMVTYTQTTSSTIFPMPDAMMELSRLGHEEDVTSHVKYLILNVFFDDFMVREDTHVPEYDILSILGILGGNAGLFLGASLLTLGEFMELIILMTIGAVNRFHQLVKTGTQQDTTDREEQVNHKDKDKVVLASS